MVSGWVSVGVWVGLCVSVCGCAHTSVKCNNEQVQLNRERESAAKEVGTTTKRFWHKCLTGPTILVRKICNSIYM